MRTTWAACGVSVALVCAVPSIARAGPGATLELVHEFTPTPVPYSPTAIVRAPDGNFYGTLEYGGPADSRGALFRMTPQGVATSLHYFDVTSDGGRPLSLILGRDGFLYGTTYNLKTAGLGPWRASLAIFKAGLDGTVQILHRFDLQVGPYDDLSWARAPLVQASDGQLFGITRGVAGRRAIFSVSPAGDYAVVRSFPSDLFISPPMQASNGLLYFITNAYDFIANTSWDLTLYGLALDGTVMVAQPIGLTNVTVDDALTQGTDGSLYATARANTQQESEPSGYAFNASLDGEVQVTARFYGQDGHASGRLVPADDGSLYGFVYRRNDGEGSIFRMTPSGTLTTVVDGFHRPLLRRSTPAPPGLIAFDGAAFVALTWIDVVEAHLDGTFDTIHSFTGGSDLREPRSLLAGGNGLLHGAAWSGADGPTVPFIMTPDRAVTALRSSDGSLCFGTPEAVADDGAIWGLSGTSFARLGLDGTCRRFTWGGDSVRVMIAHQGGGVAFAGSSTVGRVTADGSIALLHQLTYEEGASIQALVRSDDGRLYGVASLYFGGSLFSIDAAGRFDVLYRFGTGAVGRSPLALVTGPGGALYGLASPPSAAELDARVLFRFDPAAGRMEGLTVMNGVRDAAHTIVGTPEAVYLLDRDGTLWQVGDSGFVYRLGSWTPLRDAISLVNAGDGTLYTATDQEPNGHGAIYSLSVPYAPSEKAPTVMVRNVSAGRAAAWRLADGTIAADLLLPAVTDRNWQLVAMRDLTGDGRTDAIWHHTTTGATVVWVLSGSTILNQIALPTVPERAWHPVASADVNRDGSPDLVWRNYRTGANAVWYLRGASLVGEASLPAVADLGWHLVGAADFNQDGAPDLVWRHARTGENVIWYLNGVAFLAQANLFTVPDPAWEIRQALDIDGASALIWQHTTSGTVVSWTVRDGMVVGQTTLATLDPGWELAGPHVTTVSTDMNGDRHPDLVWRNTATGANVLWLMHEPVYSATDGWSVHRSTQLELPAAPDLGWRLVGRADFNRDRYPDLVWRHTTTGDNAVWLVDGSQTITGLALPRAATEWELGTVADLDDDGHPDLVWRNPTTGDNVVWYLDGTGAVRRQENLPTVGDPGWHIAASADMNGDGHPDLVWRHRTSGANVVWFLDGVWLAGQASLPTVPDTDWQLVTATDIDGDEWPDLVWHHRSTGANAVWYLTGTTLVATGPMDSTPDTVWTLGP